MLQYSTFRILIFLACLGLFYALGLRSQTQMPYLVLAAALTSMVISFFALKPMREKFATQVAERVEDRIAGKRAKHDAAAQEGRDRRSADEAAEDAEVDDSFR